MSIKDSHSILCDLVVSKDTQSIEEFLLYSDNRDLMLDFISRIAGKNQLLEMSKEFTSKALRDNISNMIS